MNTEKMKTDILKLLDESGFEVTVTHYTVQSTDVWGDNKTGADSPETILIVHQALIQQFKREGVKLIEYITILTASDSVIEIGDTITFGGKSYNARGVQPFNPQDDVITKRVVLIEEEYM